MKLANLKKAIFAFAFLAMSASPVLAGTAESNSGALASSQSSIGLTFEGDKRALPQNYPGSQLQFAQMFSPSGDLPQLKGSLLLMAFPFAIAKENTMEMNRTSITYAWDDIGAVASSAGISKGVTKLEGTEMFGRTVYGKVVGSIQVFAKKGDANSVNMNTLRHNAEAYAASYCEGYTVKLVSVPTSLAFAIGVESKGKSGSISPVLSALNPVGIVASLGGLALNGSAGDGRTVMIGSLGQTFLVVLVTGNANDRIDALGTFYSLVRGLKSEAIFQYPNTPAATPVSAPVSIKIQK